MPQGVEVRTGKQQADKQTKDINDSFLNVLRTALLAFAGISLFVGAFLIFNTFSITVAQRTREFALLRVLGAKRKQVLRSVLAEGLTIGVFGSAIGLVLGFLVAGGLRALFKAFGADMPSTGTVVETRTIIVSLVVGTVVTLISTIAPAIRATRVPPLAALREGLSAEHKRSRWSTPLALGADRRWPGDHGGRPLRLAEARCGAVAHGPRRGADLPRRGVPEPAPGRARSPTSSARRSSASAA